MKQRSQQMPVEFAGVDELRKALKAYAPDLDKALKKELKGIAEPVVNKARGYAPALAPLSNWGREGGRFPSYNGALVKAGIRFSTAKSRKNNRGFSSSIRIVNATAAGAIYETAGRKNPFGQPWVGNSKGAPAGKKYSHSINKNAGRDFIAAMGGEMKGKGEDKGRLIYRAWAEDAGKTQDAMIKAVLRTNALFQSKTGGAITRGVRKVA
jgi:hypothetical protein